MTDFIAVYDKAISSLEDPILTQIYNQSKSGFCSKMYTHLSRAIWLFNVPYLEVEKLSSIVEPHSEVISFVGDGVTTDYPIEAIDTDSTLIVEATVDGKQAKGVFNTDTNTFIFDEAPANNSKVKILEYSTGCFSADLDQTELTILALLLVSCWSEKEENFLLDIRRLLTTSDFKLHDSSSVLRSKVNWHYTKYEQAQKLMNNYALNLAKRGVIYG